MKAQIVTGLLFGDEGKGATVNFLCSQPETPTLVVRYGGGAQCAHTVVRDDGTCHTFSQFGSGTLAGVPTFLSQYMCVRPDWLIEEAGSLQALGISDPFSKIYVHEDALISTIYHQEASVLAAPKHMRGTTGVGVGQTGNYANSFPDDAIKAKDCFDRDILTSKLRLMRERIAPHSPHAASLVATDLQICMSDVRLWNTGYWNIQREKGTIVFEGHQGVLLDKKFGYRPYVTSDDTTFIGADALLSGYEGQREYYGVMRTYMTRHGAGPLITESHIFDDIPEPHNGDKDPLFQGKFRRGFMDFDEVRKAIQILHEPDLRIVLTHMDCLEAMRKILLPVKYQESMMWTALLKPMNFEEYIGKPIYILGEGPRTKDYSWTR